MKGRRHVIIGVDIRKPLAAEVCKFSCQSWSKGVNVVLMSHKELCEMGLFTRTWRFKGDGTMVDTREHRRLLENQYEILRFFAPFYAKKLGMKGHVLYMDSSCIIKEDLNELFDYCKTLEFYVAMTKTMYKPSGEGWRTRKDIWVRGWQNVMMFNLYNPVLFQKLTLAELNHYKPYALENLYWIDPKKKGHKGMINAEVTELPQEWHYIPAAKEQAIDITQAKLIDYTEENPWDTLEQKEWNEEYKLYLQYKLNMVDSKSS